MVANQPEQCHHLHCEKKKKKKNNKKCFDQLRPRHPLPPNWGWIILFQKDVINCVSPNLVAERLQGTPERRIPSVLVGSRHFQKQLRELSACPWPPRSPSLAAVVFFRHQLAVPAPECFRRRDSGYLGQHLAAQLLPSTASRRRVASVSRSFLSPSCSLRARFSSLR